MFAYSLIDSLAPYVPPEAEAREVARLLGNGGGAVSVVDGNLAPIGIVTRGSLARWGVFRGAENLGAPPIFLLHDKTPPEPRLDGLSASDVMSAPAIVAPVTAHVLDVARIMEAHRINYLPLVRDGRFVGIVRRSDIVRAIEDANGKSTAVRNDGLTAAEFRNLVQEHERREDAERAERKRALRETRDQRVKELAARRLSDTRWRELLTRSRAAAASGLKEYMLIRFPSQLCHDGGRAINAPDASWPQTLRGEPADIFTRWCLELEPNGFRLAAQIVEFPDGMPGDAALFLLWGG